MISTLASIRAFFSGMCLNMPTFILQGCIVEIQKCLRTISTCLMSNRTIMIASAIIMLPYMLFAFIMILVRMKEVNFEYVLNWHCQHCCCNTIFEAWKVENVFSKISIFRELNIILFKSWNNIGQYRFVIKDKPEILQPQMLLILCLKENYNLDIIIMLSQSLQ